jgi:hypothetical protein
MVDGILSRIFKIKKHPQQKIVSPKLLILLMLRYD